MSHTFDRQRKRRPIDSEDTSLLLIKFITISSLYNIIVKSHFILIIFNVHDIIK